jgi:hypothetical protein
VTEWRLISDGDAPHACHVLATWFDWDAGEWVVQVVLSPPGFPFTHWQMLPEPPDGREKLSPATRRMEKILGAKFVLHAADDEPEPDCLLVDPPPD